MQRPLLSFSQSDYLIQIVDINSLTYWHAVQIQISWLLQKPTDLSLHCFQMQGISGFSRTRINTPPIKQGTWVETWKKYLLTCTQRRLKSACASTQSDLSIRCPHEEFFFHPWLSKTRPVKFLIRFRLCKCADWSEFLLGAHVWRYVFSQCDSYYFITYREREKTREKDKLSPVTKFFLIILGPVVQSIVSLTSSLRVISLTVLADSIYNILICFAEKMWVAKSYSHFFSKKFQHICVSLDVNFNESLTNDIVSFEQLGPVW